LIQTAELDQFAADTHQHEAHPRVRALVHIKMMIRRQRGHLQREVERGLQLVLVLL
jgi:hypothetical protein